MVTETGNIKGKISFYCSVLKVSRQGFYSYLENLSRPYKYKALVALIQQIIAEDECNDTYGSVRIWEALLLIRDTHQPDLHVPSQPTIARIMRENGLNQKKKQGPKGLTKADREAMPSPTRTGAANTQAMATGRSWKNSESFRA